MNQTNPAEAKVCSSMWLLCDGVYTHFFCQSAMEITCIKQEKLYPALRENYTK